MNAKNKVNRVHQGYASKCRFIANDAGKRYCVKWKDARQPCPVCRECSLCGAIRDCNNNPIGQRDWVVARALCEAKEQYALELTMKKQE